MLKQLYEFGLWCYCFWFTARLLQEFKKFQTEAEGREEELHKEIELSQERLIDAEVKKNIVTFNFICTKFNLRLKIKSWLEQCLNCYLRINLLVLHQLSFLALQLVVSLFCHSLFRSACVFWEKSQVYYSGGIQTHELCSSGQCHLQNCKGWGFKSHTSKMHLFSHNSGKYWISSASTHWFVWVKTKINTLYPLCKFNIYLRIVKLFCFEGYCS